MIVYGNEEFVMLKNIKKHYRLLGLNRVAELILRPELGNQVVGVSDFSKDNIACCVYGGHQVICWMEVSTVNSFLMLVLYRDG